MKLTSRCFAFTLIELLVAISIAAILLTLAVPSFDHLMRKQSVESHQREIHAMLSFARSEAVARGELVAVCGRASATTCVNTNDWSSGALVFVDDGAGSGGIASDGLRNGSEIILRDFASTNTNELLVNDSASNDVLMVFDNRGYLKLFNLADPVPRDSYKDNITFKMCDTKDDALLARAVLLQRTGRINYSADGSDSDAIHEDAQASNLSC